jgi:SNF family Na+-dependent transporter
MQNSKESWGTRVGLILAMAGNAVGLGNFLRFPVQAIHNGGGAFMIPYIVCFLLMGIPLLWIEWTMGRYGGRFGNHSTPFILDTMTKRRFWKYFGVFGIFTNIAVASYYCYIESWTLSYIFHSVVQTFDGMTQGEVSRFFESYVAIDSSTLGIPYEAVFFYLLCLVLNVYILSRGLQGGVELVSRMLMPALIIFGAFLAIRGLTMGSSFAAPGCTDCDSMLGVNYLWTPQWDSIWDFKVWLAAAGQIFFTLSVGMGTIHCYAAYVRSKDDVALNAMAAGWTNSFVEVVLGASVVIPISVGFLGLGWVQENAGFSMAFQTMPFLFEGWGEPLATISGTLWFGLLFFAGITSSLAMGTPWMAFMKDEFNFGQNKAAWTFGLVTLVMGLPTVFFFTNGVFDDYDYWAGTFSLVVFAFAEVIIFSWIFGADKGYDELMRGADLQVPAFVIPIFKYVTPLILGVVLVGGFFKPAGNDWAMLAEGRWELDAESVIGKVQHKSRVANRQWFADAFESEVSGTVLAVHPDRLLDRHVIKIGNPQTGDTTHIYRLQPDLTVTAQVGQVLGPGTPIASGSIINDVFYIDMGRVLLILLFLFLAALVWYATFLRRQNPRIELPLED